MYRIQILNKVTGECVKELKAGSFRMARIIESGIRRNLNKEKFTTQIVGGNIHD